MKRIELIERLRCIESELTRHDELHYLRDEVSDLLNELIAFKKPCEHDFSITPTTEYNDYEICNKCGFVKDDLDF